MKRTKGTLTKESILNEGFDFVCAYGFTDLSIGKLAKKCNMSRSGLFSHFDSKEQLQIEILLYAERKFKELVIDPTLELENSKEKLAALCELWPSWLNFCSKNMSGGCLFMSASFELSFRDGVVKEHLHKTQKKLLRFFETIFKSGIKRSELKSVLTHQQLAFDFYSRFLGFHLYNNFLGDNNSKNYLKASLRDLLASL